MVYFGLMPLSVLRAHADDVGFPHWSLDRFDAIFGAGSVPSVVLQGALSQVGSGRSLVDWLAIAVYLAWLPVGLVTMWWIVRRHWNLFPGFAWSWFGIWYLGLIAFVLLPVEPPWMLDGIERTLSDRVTGFVNLDPNQFAAFPSLHVGIPATLAFQARTAGIHWLSRALFVFAGLTAFSVVHLGEHYVIDKLGGLALAWLVVRLVSRLRRPAVLPAAGSEGTRPLAGLAATSAR